MGTNGPHAQTCFHEGSIKFFILIYGYDGSYYVYTLVQAAAEL